MITRGLESASKGMQALIEYQDVIANNLANVNTTAFKRTNMTFKNLVDARIEQKSEPNKPEAKTKDIGSLSLGSGVHRTFIDFEQGPLNLSGSKLDVAIDGGGFFKIRTAQSWGQPIDNPENYYYARDGHFTLTPDNYLANTKGDYVVDKLDRRIRIVRDPENPADGPENRINVQNDLLIGKDGTIQLTNPNYARTLQQIAIVDFQNKAQITSVGEGRFMPLAGRDAGMYAKNNGFMLEQGMLEGANANTIVEMISTINVSRTYETLSKLVKTQGDTVSQAIELGKIKG